VPLGLVARLEDIPRDKIELSAGSPVTQYRGKLMPLIALSGSIDSEKPHQAVLVFTDRDRSMGLMVDEIIDVVEDRLDIQLSGARPGLLGTGVIAGAATDVIDTGYWLTLAWKDWFRDAPQADEARGPRRVLVVEDSAFFRQLLVPSLGAAGYSATTAASAAEALKLREAGVMFDAILSDIEMPDMTGLEFARAVRKSGPWMNLPMIALTGHVEQRDIEAGRDAGFTDYVAKFERDGLLASLQQCLSETVSAT
jgi:two-component system chemotaxis sensor kinase CheA